VNTFFTQEISMNNQLSVKLTAFVVALLMNSLILGGTAMLFNSHVARQGSDSSVVSQATKKTGQLMGLL
jgi:Mn2+/Fe2+ NRAMP family transporter